uniref:Uncharacterized protein n=1 Tax=Triticum urartu TaxID=4572 RepID=A0A8R7U341_TRIUA
GRLRWTLVQRKGTNTTSPADPSLSLSLSLPRVPAGRSGLWKKQFAAIFGFGVSGERAIFSIGEWRLSGSPIW